MSFRQSFTRCVIGLGTAVFVVTLACAALLPATHRWGATTQELARTMPGDEVLPQPAIEWLHAATINAPPERVWPWVAQLGDERGGFYSYTVIENLAVRAMGIPGQAVTYRNANQIVPEWQQPQPGDSFIRGMLRVREVEPGRWLVAEPSGKGFGWSWAWLLEPQQNGSQTRLLVRMRIGGAEATSIPPMVGVLLEIGSFVMEQRMVQGIVLRAEGGTEPPFAEALEITLWFSILSLGVMAGWLFVRRRAWQWPIGVGITAALALVIVTLVQPPIWTRVALVAILIAGLWRAGQGDQARERSTPRVLAHAAR